MHRRRKTSSPVPQTRTNARPWSRGVLVAAALGAASACNTTADDAADGSSASAEAPAGDASPGATGPVATVASISGPGGLRSPQLQPGAFLGSGATLDAGQQIETPRGTLAEVSLADGTKIRLNEATTLTVPTAKWPRRLQLASGEVVVVAADGAEAVEVVAGAETLSIAAGEVQVRNTGDARRFAMVSGRASLKTPSKELTLGPGETIDTPLPEDVHEPAPKLSLTALDETAWSRTFAAAARMTEAVPRGVGSLTARRAGSRREQQKLRLTEQSVTVNIAGRVAHTQIEQAFFNDQPAVLEGIYRFPLPSDGSISGLGLLVGNRWMEGEVLEKQRARSIFKQIVDATIPRDPALLEWEQGNLFKLRIFPIPGRGERKVRLSYTQVLPVVAGKLRYRFPMGGSGAGGTPIDDFTFTVNVDRSELDSQQLAQIDTPMLAMDQSLDGETVKLTTAVRNFIPTSDLGIDVPLAEAAHRVHAATHLDRDGQAYFMLALRPEFDSGQGSGPTNLAFVVDRSHSTTPELWTLAKGIVQSMTSSLAAEDRFTVLACDTACERMPGGLVPPSVGASADAGQFLAEQDLAGASDIGAMMRAGADALTDAPAGDRVVVYLGDGAPSSGALATDDLSRTLAVPMQGTRVLALALGSRSDLTALGAVLDATGGEVVRVDPRDNPTELVRDLALRAKVPMVSDIELDLPDGMLMVRKQGQTGLRKDDTLVIAGKLSHPVSGDVVVRGRNRNGPVEASFPVELSAVRPEGGASSVHHHLPRTWAQMQIAHLTKTKGASATDEIVRLSQDYTVLSRFTAMLVLENDAMFREFNVVRREEDKDRWDGNLPAPEEETAAASRGHNLHDGRNEEKNKDSGGFDSTLPGTLSPLGEGGGGNRTKGGSASADPSPDDQTAIDELLDPSRSTGAAKSAPSDPRPAPPAAEPVPEPEPFPGSQFEQPPAQRPSRDDGDGGFDLGDVSAGEDDDFKDDFKKEDKFPASGSAPRKPAETKKKRKSKPSATPWSGNAGGGVVGGAKPSRRGGWGGWRPAPPQLRTRTVSAPDTRALARVDDLALKVAADPTRRSAHGRLVRSAIRAGHPRATEFARAWAEVDPEHPPALLSLADVLASAGDPMAQRAYASAVEVRPFDVKQHRQLAEGLAGKGDLQRACSHRHALVSIDPKKVDHHADLVRCLVAARRSDDARRALADARTRAQGSSRALTKTFTTLDAEIAGAVVPPTVSLHGVAELKASLTWSGEDELDIVVVDHRGKRLSVMRPGGKVRVRQGRGSEELTMRRVKKSVFVEVTRATDDPLDELAAATPVSGTLTIRTTGGRRKSIPFTMRGGTIRLAKVFWRR